LDLLADVGATGAKAASVATIFAALSQPLPRRCRAWERSRSVGRT